VVALRRAAFESVGGFNEAFFIYYQDPDLCLRLARKGWEIRFAPVTDVVHHTGASTSRARAWMARELFVSSMRFARIHYGTWHRNLLLLVWRVILSVRLVRDRIRLAACGDAARRQVLAEDVRVWKRALRWRFRDLEGARPP
jgi:GT2 family glycosyltransferase